MTSAEPLNKTYAKFDRATCPSQRPASKRALAADHLQPDLEIPAPQNIEEPVGVVISEKSSYKTSNAGARWVAVGISLTPDLNRARKQVALLDASMVIAVGAKIHRVQAEQPCPVGMPDAA